MWQRFTERARRVVFFAQEEAAHLGENYVGTEHLLLAIVRESDSVAANILGRIGVALGQVRWEVERQVTPGSGNLGQDMELTPRAKRVIDLAYEEARRLNNSYIGTEHLLLGMIVEGDGLAARVLVKLGADLVRTRQVVHDMLEEADPGYQERTAGSSGSQPEDPPIDPGPIAWQRFTERARRVVFFAQEEAARLGENYVGTEHLLLGLTRGDDTVAARVLGRARIALGDLRKDVERQATRGHGNLGVEMQLTPRAKRVIDFARDEARRLDDDYVGTEHLLLGMIRQADGLAARVLIKRGAELERVRAVLEEMRTGESRQSEPAGDGGATPLPMLRAEAESPRRDVTLQGAERTALVAVERARQVCQDLTDLRSINDLSVEQAWALLALARILKDTLSVDKLAHWRILEGKSLAMIFEKPSLRTRVTFETGMFQMGGNGLYLLPSDISMGQRESVPDVAHNLERWMDGIMARVFKHQTVLDLAEHSRVPVINGLCDREHPCQALSDFQTIWERRGRIEGLKIAYVGDGNNVAHSLLLLGVKLGAHVSLACPAGYEPLEEVVESLGEESRKGRLAKGGSVTVTNDPRHACADADAIYTDVWASMGQEDEAAERAKIFAPFQVNEELVSVAKPDYLFMHCLPAHRGEEVTAGVMDGPNSVAFHQAENRLHAQKAVLAVLLR